MNRSSLIVSLLLASAWLAATVAVPVGAGHNAAFAAALALAGIAFGLDWRALLLGARRASWGACVLASCVLASCAFALPALSWANESPWSALVRALAVLTWAALLVTLGPARLHQPLAWAALTLLGLNALLLVCDPLLPASLSSFERAGHEYVGGRARFRGLALTPAPAGVWILTSLALCERLASQRLRRLSRALALGEALATLSLATIAVPALLAALLPKQRFRWPLVGLAALAAAAVLYCQPLELALGSRTFQLTREQASYSEQGLGPKCMPIRELRIGALAVRGHATAYGKLASRALSCFAEHPLTGVAPGRFREACKVQAMNTFGEWSDQRTAHNQLGALLSELGCFGVLLLAAAGRVLWRGYRWQLHSPWQTAAWVALAVCALGAEDFLTLPVAALFASCVAQRA